MEEQQTTLDGFTVTAAADKKVRKPKAASAPRPSAADEAQIISYRHLDRRKNNPEVGVVNTSTDPGDLVLDPTCGSGTTAYVAEKWGRRWITCDTSRVAVTLAKQRLVTASYDYFALKYPHEGLKGGFIYKTVPHVTLKSIANNPDIDEIYERMHPAVEKALGELMRFS